MPGDRKEIQALIRIYIRAQADLIRIIAEQEAKGNVTAYQKKLLLQVNAIIGKLDRQARSWSDSVVEQYYKDTIEEVSAVLEKDIENPGAFSKLHTSAIQLLAENTYRKFNEANSFVGRQIHDAIREAGIEAVTSKIATGQTVKECKKNLISKLLEQGVNGIKDRRGRMISISSYAATVARSTTAEVTNTATKNQLQNLGYDLVKVTEHNTTCPVCSVYQGRVYSISGLDSRFPRLSVAFSGDYLNIHPNCRHRIYPYIPELADDLEGDIKNSSRPFDVDERSKKAIEDYNKQQKDKAQLRNDRDQYEKYKLVLGNDVPKTFAAFRKMKYNNSERFEDVKGLFRYLKNNPESNKTFFQINKEIKKLISQGKVTSTIGTAVKPIPKEFNSVHKHARKRMNERNVLLEDVQSYIDKAKVMFRQNGGEKNAYYSEEGSASIVIDEKLLVTLFSREQYDDGAKAIMEVVNRYGD